MNKIIQLILKILAKAIIYKHRPKIIGITGSVGKTSTKEFVYQVLFKKYRVRKNIKNYNNEIGLPLTIIGLESPGRSISGWLKLFFKSLEVLFKKGYPEILVLEMGIDKPGDMAYLLSIVKCDVGILTRIGYSHLEYFKTIEKVREEKGLLVKSLDEKNWAVLNYDDENVRSLATETHANVLTYGSNDLAIVKAQNIRFEKHGNSFGSEFDVVYKNIVHVSLDGLVGKPVIEASLAAACVGMIFDIDPSEIPLALKEINPIAGRMNFIAGQNDSIIIDDTYNASPQSTIAALNTAKEIDAEGRRIAVLSDMLELGEKAEEGHREVGKRVAELGFDILIAVGKDSYFTALSAKIAGMDPNNVFYFKEHGEVPEFLLKSIQPADLILVKGSQGMRMEKIVKQIMAEPEKAGELLVRQDEEWLKK
ncbi:MAG: UDP-N-acetylmuramoyl-tripeptide--D-alanyl-D-alanine ligase [Candidatus Omnitrophica bacterium]|nr:UDP-N-acetylmuramoyl-tripeptide--D-alanyl-D-alanine ligase [Candidatus Omnitrophota bacterium]